MSKTFLDTSFLVALLVKTDELHAAAAALEPKYRVGTLTTEYVLVELLDSITVPSLRPLAHTAVGHIRSDTSIHVVPASATLFESGLDLYRTRPDKSWGLTDCISFAVMQREGITDALTADRHFEQAGFRALLRAALQ